MYPILLDSSIKRALSQSASQVRLSDEKAHEILNNITAAMHSLPEGMILEKMMEIKLELKNGKLVSVSCDADSTSRLSVKQGKDFYTVILQRSEGDAWTGERDHSLEIKIAVVA